MITRILDTSVALAWYLPESFSLPARTWRERLLEQQVRLIVPSLHFWETANVLRTYVRRGELPEDLAMKIYEVHLMAGLEVKDPPRDSILQTALEYSATVYDAVYIALSLQGNIPLLTAEKTTAPWVVKMGGLVESISPKSKA